MKKRVQQFDFFLAFFHAKPPSPHNAVTLARATFYRILWAFLTEQNWTFFESSSISEEQFARLLGARRCNLVLLTSEALRRQFIRWVAQHEDFPVVQMDRPLCEIAHDFFSYSHPLIISMRRCFENPSANWALRKRFRLYGLPGLLRRPPLNRLLRAHQVQTKVAIILFEHPTIRLKDLQRRLKQRFALSLSLGRIAQLSSKVLASCRSNSRIARLRSRLSS